MVRRVVATGSVVRAVGVAAIVILSGLTPLRAQPPAVEYRLKAAFLYRFPGFVEWPSAVLTGRPDIEVCVVRPNPIDTVLRDLVAGEKVNDRPFTVREIDRDESLDTCHELFIPSRASSSARAVLRKAQSLPILTVGDYEGFLDDGGMIALRTVDGRIRFDVATDAARKVGLRLSSQLLKLALNTK